MMEEKVISLDECINAIGSLDEKAMAQAKRRWDQVAKPLNSLGLLEEALITVAGIQGTSSVCLDQKAVAVFCGDNGIVEEGVTQTGQEVTAVVAENFSRGDSCVCIMAEQAGARVVPVDMGVKRLLSGYGSLEASSSELSSGIKYPILNCRIMAGTRNFLKEPAMEREQAVKAIEAGIQVMGRLKKAGVRIVATGEMGIGNTTTSSAVSSVLLGCEPEMVTGRGAGLDSQGLKRKIQVIRQGIKVRRPDPEDGIDVLAKVGGLDLAGMTGAFLGAGLYRIPVVIDGVISGAAALAAAAICPAAVSFMLASHVSREPAHQMILDRLGLKPLICAQMCLGEGTGAVALFPLLDMAEAVYRRMSTFQEIQIEEYHPLE